MFICCQEHERAKNARLQPAPADEVDWDDFDEAASVADGPAVLKTLKEVVEVAALDNE